MSSMDQTKDDSLIQSETMQRILHQQSHYPVMPSIRLSSSMRQTTQRPMYNSYLGRALKNSPTIVDSSLPVIIKIKSLHRSIPVVRSLSLALKVKKKRRQQLLSSPDLTLSWTKRGAKLIRRSSLN